MITPDADGGTLVRTINRVALYVLVGVLTWLAGLAWESLSRPPVQPHWPGPAMVALTSVAPLAGERWIVAVNPDCRQCGERLAGLAGALATRPRPPVLGVLLVDVGTRPDSLVGATRFPGGVWWDPARVWRSRWRRNAYGEVLVFAPDGRLRGILPPDSSTTVLRP